MLGVPENEGAGPRQLCFLLIIKADQRAWLCRSRSRRGSLRRPVIKASVRCLCPAGQPTSITAAPVNRGRQPRPQCPARHRVLGKLSQEGPGPWLLSETQQEKRTSPTPPATPALGIPGARRTLTSVGGDRLKANRSQSLHQRRGPQQGPQLRSICATPGPPRHSRGLGLTRSRVE